MINILKDVLITVKNKGLTNNNHIYITFLTKNTNVIIPKWLKDKYPQEMTIVIQYEYYDLEIKDEYFKITLSFNDVKTKLKISYDSIISFADPSANFGLKLKNTEEYKKINKNENETKDNVINFSNFKKN